MFDLYLQYEYWLAVAQLVLAMFGMGATLKVRDFAAVLAAPRAIAVGLVVQIIAVPLLAALFLWALELDTGVAIGLAMCAAIPGGTVSNVFTFIGRGHVALSIALTGITTAACLVTTPIVLGFMITQHMPADFSMPAGAIAREIGLALLLPLVLGMGFLSLRPDLAPTVSRYSIRASLTLIIVIAVGATGSGRVDLPAFGIYNLVVVNLFMLFLATSSWLLPKLLGLERRDITAINIEVTARNASLGVMLAASMFPAATAGPGSPGANALFTVLIYGGAGILAGLALMNIHRRLNRLEPIGD
ncbi:MAG: bile acid:sodium symporter [Pseudomonadota bacterium]